MRVIVCGGRDYRDRERVRETLDALDITALAHGAAPGADGIAEWWARERGISSMPFPARWREDGPRAAGPIRNQRMLEQFRPDAVIAFPGGRGTADMVRRARAAGVRVIAVADDADPFTRERAP